MNRNEEQTRTELIDIKLKRAGWNVCTTRHDIKASTACIETPVTGMPKTSNNASGNGFVDYVLFGDNGKPLALIETKRTSKNEEDGRAQAGIYANCLEAQYGIRPIIYYSNGYTVKIADGRYPARTVHGFHTKEELEWLLQKRNLKVTDNTIAAHISGRYYQQDAIKTVLHHFEHNSRSLVVLATGTGKTRVSCALTDILIRNNCVKRVLFLADRKNLVIQAKEETFEKFLPTIPMQTIIEGKWEGAESARIVFSTYQSMLSIISDTTRCPFGIGHFDLIIVDEAHRSLFNKYAAIFEYFDALMLGLTATPRNDVGKSTYQVFNLDENTPNYEYELTRAVKDGFLVYFRALDRTPDILREGLRYDELKAEEREQYEELFTDDDGDLPDKIDGEKFKSVIMNKDTIRNVLRALMNEGIYVNNGNTLGKTIIFARDHEHAVMIQNIFREMYPELCDPNMKDGADYCVVIDNRIAYNEALQREFKNKQNIRIVVSVDMMDTGVDIPEVVNLVFFKKVMSKIKFWQMIGRGTRTCKDLYVKSPQKGYFERSTNDSTRTLCTDKQGFLIFDVCNVFHFFHLNPDGAEPTAYDELSLNQKIFVERVMLCHAMQQNYTSLDAADRAWYERLKKRLAREVQILNRNYVQVQSHMKAIEHFSEEKAWSTLSNADCVSLRKEVAPCIVEECELPAILYFDYLMYKIASARLLSHKDLLSTSKIVHCLVSKLEGKKHLPEVLAEEAKLDYLYTQPHQFAMHATVTETDKYRAALRDLMRFIDEKDVAAIVSDFHDMITVTGDAEEDPVDLQLTMDDFTHLQEKLEFFIEHGNHPVVHKIRQFEPLYRDEVDAFANVVKAFDKDNEYSSLFETDDDLLTFIRQYIGIAPEAQERVMAQLRSQRFNEPQMQYAETLMVWVNANGALSYDDLLTPDLDCGDVFANEELGKMLNIINSHMAVLTSKPSE